MYSLSKSHNRRIFRNAYPSEVVQNVPNDEARDRSRSSSSKDIAMTDEISSMNDVEQKRRDLIKHKLGTRATITYLKRSGDRIAIHVVSPCDFRETAGALEEISNEVTAAIQCALDVTLSTAWRVPGDPEGRGCASKKGSGARARNREGLSSAHRHSEA